MTDSLMKFNFGALASNVTNVLNSIDSAAKDQLVEPKTVSATAARRLRKETTSANSSSRLLTHIDSDDHNEHV